MSTGRRIGNVLTGVMMLALSLLLVILDGGAGFVLVAVILSLTLVAAGLRALHYYFTMARHMVGGKAMLCRGVILLDLGVFTTTLTDVPKLYIVLYLLAVHAFAEPGGQAAAGVLAAEHDHRRGERGGGGAVRGVPAFGGHDRAHLQRGPLLLRLRAHRLGLPQNGGGLYPMTREPAGAAGNHDRFSKEEYL